MSCYPDRYGLEANAVLRLEDGRYAFIEFKLGSFEVDLGAKRLLKIEGPINKANEKEVRVPIRLPDLKTVVTGGQYGYRREDGIYVVPIGCLRDWSGGCVPEEHLRAIGF